MKKSSAKTVANAKKPYPMATVVYARLDILEKTVNVIIMIANKTIIITEKLSFNLKQQFPIPALKEHAKMAEHATQITR